MSDRVHAVSIQSRSSARIGLPGGLLALALLAWPLALGCAPGPASASSDVPAEYRDRQNTVTLDEKRVRYYQRQFKGKCARCHGLDGTGKGKEAAEQAVKPADFSDAGFMKTRTDGELFYQILVGGEEKSAMPAFGPTSAAGWSEEKIWGMVAFIRRFAEAEQP